jgi:hypothetical protein
MRVFRYALPAAVACVCCVAAPAAAQRAPSRALPQWEGRIEATAARFPAAHAGIGINRMAGTYARIGVAVSAGTTMLKGDNDWHASQRVDLTARFLLDPLAERRFGLYGGAGIGVQHRRPADQRVVGSLLLLVGLEGSVGRGPRTALEITLGGGARLAVVLRGRRDGYR